VAGRNWLNDLYLHSKMANGENSNRKRLALIVGGIIVAVVLLAAFISLRHSAVAIRAAVVTRGPIASVISTNGKIEPVDNFEAHAPAPTTVKKIYVKAGEQVKTGQIMVQLDDADARAEAAKAEAQLRAADAELSSVKSGGTQEEVLTNQAQLAKARTERAAAKRNLDALQALHQRGAASAEEVQAAQNRLNAAEADFRLFSQKKNNRFSTADIAKAQATAAEAQAQLSAAQDLLRKSDIRAPRDGEVYSLPVRQGQYVAAGDLIVAVANLKTVEVRAFVDEPDIGRLRKDQTVEITWDAIPDRVWKGTLTQLPTNVTTLGTRNVGEITCAIENSDGKLLPNVNVSVSVVTARDQDALTIPREAVHQDANGRFVYQVVNDELKRTPIETSVSNLTRVEVTNGVQDNAVIALGTYSTQQLRDGLPVRVVAQ
jgi:HlyD family secretion protein